MSSTEIRIFYIKIIHNLWGKFGDLPMEETDEFYKGYIFETLLETLSEGFYKSSNIKNCASDFDLFIQIIKSESFVWKTLHRPAFKCAEAIILQFSAKKPDNVSGKFDDFFAEP